MAATRGNSPSRTSAGRNSARCAHSGGMVLWLFVILWVLKPGPKPEDKQKMTEEQIKVFAAIREAFKYEPDPQSQDPIDIEILLRDKASTPGTRRNEPVRRPVGRGVPRNTVLSETPGVPDSGR